METQEKKSNSMLRKDEKIIPNDTKMNYTFPEYEGKYEILEELGRGPLR